MKAAPTNKKKALLVKRGNCTFVTKTRNAQQVGADLVIIYNNDEGEIRMNSEDKVLKDIRIPSISVFAMSQEYLAKIKAVRTASK
jgi:hypothetical protein